MFQGVRSWFCSVKRNCSFSYKCDNLYNKESEGSVKFNDSDLDIDWKISEADMILSEKIRTLRLLKIKTTKHTMKNIIITGGRVLLALML